MGGLGMRLGNTPLRPGSDQVRLGEGPGGGQAPVWGQAGPAPKPRVGPSVSPEGEGGVCPVVPAHTTAGASGGGIQV